MHVSRRPQIVFAEMPEAAGRDISIERRHLPPGACIKSATWSGDRQALIDACQSADAVLTDYVPFGREVLEHLPALKVISVAATGWDCVDTRAAADLGIAVLAVGEYCTNEVADHTMALLLAMNRRLREYDRQVQLQKNWRWDAVPGIRALKGQILGLVGYGRIGRALAHRARGFGLDIIATDPLLGERQPEEPGVRSVSFDTLLAEADIVSLHCPLTPENVGLFDATTFAALRRRPLLINTSRGGLIVERDLADALDSGRVAGAALDVLADNSPDLASHPLHGRQDVLLTPHVAFYSDASVAEVRRVSADNIRYFLKGRLDKVDRLVSGSRTRRRVFP